MPEPVIALVKARQHEVDVDGDEAGLVEEFFRSQLEVLRYDVATDLVFIPSAIANQWHAAALNERISVTKSTQWLRTQIEQGAVPHLSRCRTESKRGFIWSGEAARSTQEVLYDIDHRLELSRKTSSGWVTE
jgi:hypothetical protein